MPLDAAKVPIMRANTFTDAGGSLDFSASGQMGSAYVINDGPDDAYIAFDAIPPNTIGNGQIRLQKDRILNLDDIAYSSIGVRAKAAGSCVVQAIGVPRPGNGGAGLQ